jgi:hypothetical protein
MMMQWLTLLFPTFHVFLVCHVTILSSFFIRNKATWLAFGVSLGSVVACIDQIQQQEMESQVAQFRNEKCVNTDGTYVNFQDDED